MAESQVDTNTASLGSVEDYLAPAIDNSDYTTPTGSTEPEKPLTSVDDALLQAVEDQESSHNERAVGPMTKYGSAKGLMQLIDSTGQEQLQKDIKEGTLPSDTEYDPFNPKLNKQLGKEYLETQVKNFGSVQLGLAAYNYGPPKVKSLQAKYGESYDDIAAYLPGETQKYVPSILSKRDNILGKSTPLKDVAADAPQKVPNTVQGFADSLYQITSKPEFNNLSYDEQIGLLNSVYKSKDWPKETSGVYKNVANSFWDTALPEERPDLGELVGPPPVTPQGGDADKSLAKWQQGAIQKLLYDGINPAQFGDKLDQYFTNASKAEKDASAYWNESEGQIIANETGNTLRDVTKGAIGVVSDTVGYAYRLLLGSNVDTQTANTIETTPEVLGKPSQPYLYDRTPTGALLLNSDGTPRSHAQSTMLDIADSAARTIGFASTFLSGAGELKAITGPKTFLTAINAENALLIGGSSYKSVYNQTGDASKSYKAAALAMPAAVVLGTLGETMILSKQIPAATKALTSYDQARIIGGQLFKKVTAGTVAGAGIDIGQQVAESSQTGQKYDPTRTVQMAGGGAVFGAVGANLEQTHAMIRDIKIDSFTNSPEFQKHITDFRNGIESVKTVQGQATANSFSNDLGIDVLTNEDGTTTLTKRVDHISPNEDLPNLLNELRNTSTPEEVQALAKRQGDLSSKEVRTKEEDAELARLNDIVTNGTKPEYLNNVRALEGKVLQVIKDNPGELFARWDNERNLWQNPETGETAKYLKDIVYPKKEPVQNGKDLSDLSNIRVLDEEALVKPKVEDVIDAKAHEEDVNLENSLNKVNENILNLKNQKDSLNAETDKEAIKDISTNIKEETQKKRTLQQNRLKLKSTLDIEKGANESARAKVKDLQKQYQSDKSLAERVSKKGLGAHILQGDKSTIVIPKGLTPEVKAEVLAHELGHALSDKLNLSDEAKSKIEERLNEIKDRSVFEKVGDLPKRVFLPQISKLVKLPEDANFNKLDKKSRDALTGERELLANQIGAIILKRAGKPIGDYQIIPEIEEALKDTKLPGLEPATKVPTQEQAVSTIENNQSSNEPPSNRDATGINPFTGNEGETAYSKTVTRAVPERPKDLYEKVSIVKSQEEMNKFVDDIGLEKSIDIFKDEKAYSILPQNRALLANAIESRARGLIDSDPSSKNYKIFNEASQIRSGAGTTYAQSMRLLSRFRTADTFPDFLAKVAQSYREAGLTPPKLEEYQLKELKQAFDKIKDLGPENVLRAKRVSDLFRETLKMNKMDWPDFLATMMQRNLLTGAGTSMVVAASSFWMGPIVTALSNPFIGRGLLFKAMMDIAPLAKENAKNAFAGRDVYNMYRGTNSLDYIKPTPSDSVSGTLAKAYLKFTNPFVNALSAAHVWSSTLAESAYLAEKQYYDLKTKYGNDTGKFTAEVAKIRITKDQIAEAKKQATAEAKELGGDLNNSDINVRAYQIIRQQSLTPETIYQGGDWTIEISHMGKPISPIHQMALGLINSRVFNDFIPARILKTAVLPFGNALIRLSDFAFNFVPGVPYAENFLFRDVTAKFSPDLAESVKLTENQKLRLQKSQVLGIGLAFTLLGLSRSGAIKITGDPEKQLGENKGKAAKSRKDFKEAEQTGEADYSILIPGSKYGIEYKDFPGLNAIAYGIHRVNKAVDTGGNLMDQAAAFFKGSVMSAVPFFGNSSLEVPYVKMVQDLLDTDHPDKIQKSLSNFTDTVSKEVIPASSLLRDVKHIYDSTPEETNQNLAVKIFRDVPGISEALGSKEQVDRVGIPVQRDFVERFPGLHRVVSEEKTPSDPFWVAVKNHQLIIPEMPTTIKFKDADFKHATSNYKASEDERIAKMGSLSMTPDEWNDFRRTTGPFIKAKVLQIMANERLDHDRMQELVINAVSGIEKVARENYIRTGKFN